MARPGILCHLKKGQMIDTQVGFVDTFNWMVDYINNLRGDGNNIDIENPVGTNPVVRFVGEIPEGGGGGKITVKIGDDEYTDIDTLKFETADDSEVTFAGEQTDNELTIKIGVHYFDGTTPTPAQGE